jgi:hypothetical protein
MEKVNLVGTWRLVSSVEAHSVEGDILHVYGQGPLPLLAPMTGLGHRTGWFRFERHRRRAGTRAGGQLCWAVGSSPA